MVSPTKLHCFHLFLLLILKASSHSPNGDHTCSDFYTEENPQFVDIEEDMSSLTEGRILSPSYYPNIRIYPYYDFLKSGTSTSYASYITDELIPPVIDYFQAALKIRYPVSDKILLGHHSLICERPTPPILQSGGVATDLFVYFEAEPSNGTQIASSKYCYLSVGTKRPAIARTMINTNLIPIASDDVLTHEKNMYVIMHEMVHNLGFSINTYKFFIDNAAQPRTNHIKTVKIAGVTRTVIDVPPLTQKLRDFYGCPTLEGAIMEDGGGTGKGGSHFERKFFVYEAMSSGSILGRRISEFTLALLEGSGWYVPDYSFAEPFFYGQGQGCSFITESCTSSFQFQEFCAGIGHGCAPSGRGGGTCHNETIMEGCLYYRLDTEYDCENYQAAESARLPGLEAFGRGVGSRCFTGDLSIRQSIHSRRSFCFNYTCSGSGVSARLEVVVGSRKVYCTKAERKTLDGFYGSIDCPDPLEFCNTVGKQYCPRNCMGRGTCIDSKCQCETGYKGVDCSLKV